ncbi:hypothetical protein ANCDUO_23814, partial [Ancylostoma duodenale]
ENSISQKKRRHSKKKTKEKLKEVSQNIQIKAGSSPPTHTSSPSGNALLEELQKKVRTGKVPVNEVMGPGYGQQSGAVKSQSNASIGRSILQRLVGNNVDPEAIFSAALRQMPQVPGFPSIGGNGTYCRDSRQCRRGSLSPDFLLPTSMSMYQNSNQSIGVTNNQKTRKPYFMPYMSLEAVTRGLASGDLVKVSYCYVSAPS